MLYTNATALRKNCFGILKETVLFNEVVNVNTKDGNAVILSEEDYRGLLATLEICSDPQLKEKILAGKDEPIEDCVSLDEVDF